MTIWYICIGFIAGILCTCIARNLVSAKGVLKVSKSEYETGAWSIQVDDLDKVEKKLFLVLDVVIKDDGTQN